MTNRLNIDGGGQNGTTWKQCTNSTITHIIYKGSHYPKGGTGRGTIFGGNNECPCFNNTQIYKIKYKQQEQDRTIFAQQKIADIPDRICEN